MQGDLPTEEVMGVAHKVCPGFCTSGSRSVGSRRTFVLVSSSGLGKVTEFRHVKCLFRGKDTPHDMLGWSGANRAARIEQGLKARDPKQREKGLSPC